MPEELMRRCLDEITAISDDTTVILHGGEPVMVGRDTLRRFLEYGETKEKSGKKISYDLQTNGMVLDQEWMEMLQQYRVSLGFSIDGPENLHDTYRKTHHSMGSHHMVCQNLALAGRAGIDKNCLCVITDKSVAETDRIHDFFSGLDIRNLDFLPCMNESHHRADLTLSPESYAEFVIRYMNLRNAENNGYTVRSFDDFSRVVNHKDPVSCHLKYPKICGWEVIAIDTGGDVYPCDLFAGHTEFLMGNIATDGLEKIFSSEKSRALYEMANTIPDACADCPDLGYCFGGCLYHRFFAARDLKSKSFYCGAYRKIFRYLKSINKNSCRFNR